MTDHTGYRDAEIMTQVVRDDVVESVHHGSALAVKGFDKLEQMGAVDHDVYYRSSLKPFQTLPLLDSGAFEKYGLEERHLAIASGSIDANADQIEIVRDMLERGGLSEKDLLCPSTLPDSRSAAAKVLRAGGEKSPIYHNCSGKHAGMLLASLAYSAPTERYLELDHPIQKHIFDVMKVVLGIVHKDSGGKARDQHFGGDGCGAPCLKASLYEMATSYSLLARPTDHIPEELGKRMTRIARAMATYPELVGGDDKRVDTDIMRASKGELFAKVGAEGLICVGRFSDGMALAMKVADGDWRGLRPACVAWLKMLGMLPQDTGDVLGVYEQAPVISRGEKVVGYVTYCGKTFSLT